MWFFAVFSRGRLNKIVVVIQHDALNDCKFKATQCDRFGIYLHWNELDCNICLTFYMWSDRRQPSHWQGEWQPKPFAKRKRSNRTDVTFWQQFQRPIREPCEISKSPHIVHMIESHTTSGDITVHCTQTHFLKQKEKWLENAIQEMAIQIISIWWAHFSSRFLVTLKVSANIWLTNQMPSKMQQP